MTMLLDAPPAKPTSPAAPPRPPTLGELAVKWGTDKRVGIHAYTKWYDQMWAAARSEPITFLEIGVRTGASIRMWEDYFPRARLVGLDIDPRCAVLAGPRTRIFIGSRDDPTVAARIKALYPGGFDIVIDDGAHDGAHQQASFDLYFTHLLKPGGSYVIEDLHCGYPPQCRGAAPKTIIGFLKDRVDDLNLRGQSGAADFDVAEPDVGARRPLGAYERLIESITLVQGMAVIAKRSGGKAE